MNRRDAASVVLFEGGAVEGLGPIVHTRPAFELRVGALNLRERVELAGRSVRAHVREELRAMLPTVLPNDVATDGAEQEVLVLDARVLATVEALRDRFDAMEAGEGVRAHGAWICARIEAARLDAFLADPVGFEGLREVEGEGLSVVQRPWTLVARNDEFLVHDHRTLRERGAPVRRVFGVEFVEGSPRGAALASDVFDVAEPRLHPGAIFVDASNVLMGEGVRVRPGAIVDAEKGPVILGAGVVVHPGAVVVGPTYLGPGTVVNPGAKLREGTSVGALCKVGGEIEETIMLDLSNKQHDGFLGHALVGSWVNLGADTNGSDLKNNYGSVRVDLGHGAEDSGESFVGQHLADHVKTGIDTMLTTGGVVGVAANVFGGGFVPRFVPAFAWGGAEGLQSYRFEAAIETACKVFGRRDVKWDERHEALLRHVHARTQAQRQAHCRD